MSNQTLKDEKLWTPANVVTLLRICGVPLFVVALISPWPTWFGLPDMIVWKEWVAASIFIILAATDGLDGYLARSRGEITNFGKFVDPLADKILVAAALLALIELNVLPSWVALVILCREFIISGIRMLAATQGVVIAASWYGKAKTVAQIIAIVLFIIKDNHMVSDFSAVFSDRLYLISWAVMIIALILTIVSLLDYFAKARHLLGFSPKEKKQSSSKQNEESGPRFSPKTNFSVENSKIIEDIASTAKNLIDTARKANVSLGTAESCTGGMIATSLTAIAGSSDVIAGAIVSYLNEVKHEQLGVAEETLTRYGAVSEQTALEMAEGAREALGVGIAVSVTGIAGPGGGSTDKPVGTVWIGLARSGESVAKLYHFEGDREQVRLQSTLTALLSFQNALS